MSAVSEVQSGLEGMVAFATEIAEPDRAGGALRYRGVDIEELVGAVPFEQVWGLLVDGRLLPGMPSAEPHPLSMRSGDPRVDVQAALAMLGPQWGFGELIDISDEEARDNLARASVMALFVAQSARGIGKPPVSQREVDKARSISERFLIRWRGEADPRHVEAIDAYWTCSTPTSSSGRRSCSTSRTSRRTCSRRYSPAPAPPAGRPTSSSRSVRAG
jgi:citrate synthase